VIPSIIIELAPFCKRAKESPPAFDASLDKALQMEYHAASWPQGGKPLSDELLVREYASAGGVVVDATGEKVLTLLRPGRPGPHGEPEVRLPKGHIEPGESRRQAALREVREESGLSGLVVLADLGRQMVEFDWKDHHFIRDESYFLMMLGPGIPPGPGTPPGDPEKQFETQWLSWQEALHRVTYEAEREWIRRAHAAWADKGLADPSVPSQGGAIDEP
jgi:8-oxo-dGTP pyrophosphatase MutT (NUDIX family)